MVIEALQYTGGEYNVATLTDWINGVDSSTNYHLLVPQIMREVESADGIPIKTLEGTMIAQKGDWIIKGIKGEFYPCKPDIFAATYPFCAVKPHPSGRGYQARLHSSSKNVKIQLIVFHEPPKSC